MIGGRELRVILYANLYNIATVCLGLIWGLITTYLLYKMCWWKTPALMLYWPVAYAFYWGIRGLLGIPLQLETYRRLHKQFKLGHIRKSILYDMSNFPCYNQIAKVLCKEFKIEL